MAWMRKESEDIKQLECSEAIWLNRTTRKPALYAKSGPATHNQQLADQKPATKVVDDSGDDSWLSASSSSDEDIQESKESYESKGKTALPIMAFWKACLAKEAV